MTLGEAKFAQIHSRLWPLAPDLPSSRPPPKEPSM